LNIQTLSKSEYGINDQSLKGIIMRYLTVQKVWQDILWGSKYYVEDIEYSASGVETILKLTDRYILVYFDGHTKVVNGHYVLNSYYEVSGIITTVSKECDT
jgi:hypothetical protein